MVIHSPKWLLFKLCSRQHTLVDIRILSSGKVSCVCILFLIPQNAKSCFTGQREWAWLLQSIRIIRALPGVLSRGIGNSLLPVEVILFGTAEVSLPVATFFFFFFFFSYRKEAALWAEKEWGQNPGGSKVSREAMLHAHGKPQDPATIGPAPPMGSSHMRQTISLARSSFQSF